MLYKLGGEEVFVPIHELFVMVGILSLLQSHALLESFGSLRIALCAVIVGSCLPVHCFGVAESLDCRVSLNIHEEQLKSFALLIVSLDKAEQQGLVRCVWMYVRLVNVVRVKEINSHKIH